MGLARSCWEGDGGSPPFLLVHGLASNRRLWDGVGPALGRRAVAVDQRGHGESSSMDGDFGSWATFVDDLVEVIASEGLDRPVAVGQSWGASVVVELAQRHPSSVSGVACVDGGVVDFRSRFPTWEACAAALAPPPLEGVPWSALEERVRSSHAGWPPFAAEAALACFDRRPDGTSVPKLRRERHMSILRLLWSHRPVEALAEVTVPVLLLPCRGGRFDQSADVAAALDALGSRGEVRWFDAHHDVHAQHPEWVAEALVEAFG